MTVTASRLLLLVAVILLFLATIAAAGVPALPAWLLPAGLTAGFASFLVP